MHDAGVEERFDGIGAGGRDLAMGVGLSAGHVAVSGNGRLVRVGHGLCVLAIGLGRGQQTINICFGAE